MSGDHDYILGIVRQAELSENDQKLWETFLRFAKEKHLLAIRQALEMDQKLIRDFTDSIKKKIRALATHDKKLWEDILQEEQEIIKRYAN